MASTNFQPGTTIPSSWLNETNSLVWTVFNGASTLAAAKTRLGLDSLGTMSTQNASSVNITGGSISGVSIGGITTNSAKFCQASASGTLGIAGEFTIDTLIKGQSWVNAGRIQPNIAGYYLVNLQLAVATAGSVSNSLNIGFIRWSNSVLSSDSVGNWQTKASSDTSVTNTWSWSGIGYCNGTSDTIYVTLGSVSEATITLREIIVTYIGT